ncbi:MAG: response regulator [Verrucomicrobiales bacterium]|nr:response regulator [Verrucomicrobiales bacterium]
MVEQEHNITTAAAFAEHERTQGAARLKVGCYLVLVLLPAGAIVDYFVYHQHWLPFLVIRLLFSGLVIPLAWLFHRPAGARHFEVLSLLVAVLPAAAICVMLFQLGKDGATSPYYASLNLIMLAIALIAQWNGRQSMVAATLLIGMYAVSAWLPNARHGAEANTDIPKPGIHAGDQARTEGAPPGEAKTDISDGIFLSNLWFMALTGIITVVGSDLSHRLRFREFQSNRELEKSRAELKTSYEQLRKLDDMKGEFFANISHELRTPLTLLLGPLESLLQSEAASDPRTRQTLETMRDNGMRLLKLINDLLDLVRLDAGELKLHRRAVDMDSFLRGILKSVQPTAQDRGIETTCRVDEDLPPIHADPDKLEKVFLNLVFNALKFTGAGGEIEVSAHRDNSDVRIEVRDTGMGIAPENLRHLFSRFWQADSASNRKFQGAGIGLALVKELVRAHDGDVEATSVQGKGTTMHVRLPVGNPPAAEPTPPADTGPATDDGTEPATDNQAAWLNRLYRRADLYASVTPLRASALDLNVPTRSKRSRVLVVDDEPEILRFIKMELEDQYAVIEAADGSQALTLAAQFLPDVIVCDLMLPEKDGMTVCRELRGRTSTKALPLLMLTARADDATMLRALEAGANDFLAKPFSVAELRARVNSLCEHHRLQRTLAENNRRLEGTIEQLKETETQLVQAEKLASLGRMSAGIIHEINNPLNFSLTALDWLGNAAGKLAPEDEADFNDTLKDIRDGLKRVSVIVGDLRTFTHPQGGELSMVSVHQSAGTALRFLTAEWKDKVDIRNEIPEDFLVPAVSNRLMQVLLNLLQNSLDALRSQPAGAEPPQIRLTAAVEGDTRVVSVRDNGPGIPEHHLAKVFDPFFTTKDVGQGTGLGLSICYRLLGDFGARLTVDSEVGRYCEFRIIFPASLPRSRDAHNPEPQSVA